MSQAYQDQTEGENQHMLEGYSKYTDEPNQTSPKSKQCHNPAHRYLQWTVIVCSISSLLAAVSLIVSTLIVRRLIEICPPSSGPHGSSVIPPIPYTMTTFQQNDLFAGPSTQENDEAWGSMMPRGDGFIIIPNPSKHNLPPGKSTPQGQIYDISLFHQLHCLAGIRRHLLLLQGSIGRNNSEEIQEILVDPQWPHIYHCFDYIRQALMCAGDMTVEWPREEEDGRRFAFDGWGIKHECRSWDAIMRFMDEHDATNYVLS